MMAESLQAGVSGVASGCSTPPLSDAFAVADIDYGATINTDSDGDLWPTAWADDGGLYAACGDGRGFGDGPWHDLVVNVIDGRPESGLTGRRLASHASAAPVWTDPARFNRKPTGMVAVDGNGDGADELYMAVQDLRCGDSPDAFNAAPAAGITWSEDYGKTWRWRTGPHFSSGQFSTVMFLDLGQSNGRAGTAPGTEQGYVYAYGIDHNWRTSYSRVVPTPDKLFLARVAASAIADLDAWEFFAGLDADTVPCWTQRMAERCAVLQDGRRLFRGREVTTPAGASPIAQGGVVFNPGLGRYLYSSWTEYSFEFYEAPFPWGPWRLFLSKDFGAYPWIGPLGGSPCHGGYAPTIPSKFISDDGRDLWVQSNWFWRASTFHGHSYCFSLRRLRLDARTNETATQPPAGENLAMARHGAHPIARGCRTGHVSVLNDGRTERAEDSWLGPDNKDTPVQDYWGYTWPRPMRMNRVVYISGPWDANGGWFASAPSIHVRQGDHWAPVADLVVSPTYPCDASATGRRAFTFVFRDAITDGLRLMGFPGGWAGYSAIAELEVYYDS